MNKKKRGKNMLNIIWPIFIIVSFVYAIITGNVESVNNSIFESTKSAIELTLSLLGTICLWNGLMEIVQNTKLIDRLTKILNPFMKFLFPKMKEGEPARKEISMNIIANILGIGNAATPLGIKAMQTMQKDNKQKERLTDDMTTFIILNTASLQIIPTTVIAIRSSLNSSNPCKIIFAVWFSTICAATVGILVTKLLIKFGK